jgi:hypothetical protein
MLDTINRRCTWLFARNNDTVDNISHIFQFIRGQSPVNRTVSPRRTIHQ